MKFCKKCGEAVEEDRKFCKKCGANIVNINSSSSKVCNKCGATVEEDRKFCNKCGANMDSSDSSSPKGSSVKEETVKKDKKEDIPLSITNAISVSGFTVIHGGKPILKNVSFDVKRGALTCLIGESGSGKSTIIESLVGRRKPNAGTIQIFNKVIGKDKKANENFGFVPQSPEIYYDQSVKKNMENSAIRYGIVENVSDVMIKYALRQVGLLDKEDLMASKLSGGQKKLLSLAMELIREPGVLILDEPTTGLDPTTRNEIITVLCSIVSQYKKSVFFTTHFMDDVEQCDDVIIIGCGKLIVQSPPEKLKKRIPGMGKMVSVVLESVNEQLVKNIAKLKDVKKVIREGRTLHIITQNPSSISVGQGITELGGEVTEIKVAKITMKEVFEYTTGQELE